MRFSVVTLFFALLTAAAHPAVAGSWVLSAAGSSHTHTVNGANLGMGWTTLPAPTASTLTLKAASTGGASTTPVTSKATMTVSITGTWTPDTTLPSDPAPPAIVTISTKASASAAQNGALVYNGAEDDGYQDAPVSGISSGTHYQSASGGSFTVSLSLMASDTSATSSPIVSVGGVTVSVSSVTLTPGGTTSDSSGSLNILVGQQCTGMVNGIPAALLNNTANPPTYAWKVSGTTFQSWGVVSDPNNQSHTVEVDAIPATSPTQWYWNDLTQKTETVKCTVMVTPPAGQVSPFSLTVTASQPISVQVPTIVMNTNEVGNGLILKSTMIAEQTSAMMNNLEDFGSSWKTAIAMPPAPAPSFGTGQWCYCQLVTPGEYVTSGGMQAETTDTKAGKGLDAAFPYNNPSANAAIEAADGSTYYNGDSPQLGPLDQTYDSATLTDTLNTYLMFKPPGNNASWVPLSESTWSTDFSAQQPAGGWSTYPSTESVGAVNPKSPQFVPGNTFPKWTQIVPTGQTETFVPYQ